MVDDLVKMTSDKAGPAAAPKVLLVATHTWIATARLAMALAEAGFAVDAVCRRSHPVRLTDATRQRFVYSPVRGLESVESAIRRSQPDLIVSCDEPALVLLYALHARGDAAMRALIERSVGDPAHHATVMARSKMMDLARDAGVAVPETRLVASARQLPACIAELGLPLVLKTDESSGGTGVRVVWEAADAARAWRLLRGPRSLARTVNRVVRDRDWTPLLGFVRRERRVVSAQRYVANHKGESAHEGNIGLVCWRGEVLASVCMSVVQTWRVTGPSSVLRVIDQPEMVKAARKLVARLGFSGFCGFDFIFDPATGRPLLLEMNPRPTQVAHLALGPGRDLAAALLRAATATNGNDRAAVTGQELIALFPQEWQRDPESPMLQGGAFHDVPYTQPQLVRAGYRMHTDRGGSPWSDTLKDMFSFPPRAHLK